MNLPPASVIIVSRGRPGLLRRCLKSLTQLWYDRFELIVVSNGEGLAAAALELERNPFKTVEFSNPNISLARNAGLAVASGDIVAFIDDDAVAEPAWLYHLGKSMAELGADAAFGHVRGRNGITLEFSGAIVGPDGREAPLALSGPAAKIVAAPPNHAARGMGTNCAFRISALADIGGFDPAFGYFLDETDVFMRMARANRRVAAVPLAEVHHQSAASPWRTESGVLRSLVPVGRSVAVFARKHAETGGVEDCIEAGANEVRKRLLRHLRRGNCMPGDVTRLMRDFWEGVEQGAAAPVENFRGLERKSSAFARFTSASTAREHVLIVGSRLHGRRLRRAAADSVGGGNIVSLHLYSHSALYHAVRFTADGYWLHTGGAYGRSERDGPLFVPMRLKARAWSEDARVAMARHPWDMAEKGR